MFPPSPSFRTDNNSAKLIGGNSNNDDNKNNNDNSNNDSNNRNSYKTDTANDSDSDNKSNNSNNDSNNNSSKTNTSISKKYIGHNYTSNTEVPKTLAPTGGRHSMEGSSIPLPSLQNNTVLPGFVNPGVEAPALPSPGVKGPVLGSSSGVKSRGAYSQARMSISELEVRSCWSWCWNSIRLGLG
jgi:hypothetical protein